MRSGANSTAPAPIRIVKYALPLGAPRDAGREHPACVPTPVPPLAVSNASPPHFNKSRRSTDTIIAPGVDEEFAAPDDTPGRISGAVRFPSGVTGKTQRMSEAGTDAFEKRVSR